MIAIKGFQKTMVTLIIVLILFSGSIYSTEIFNGIVIAKTIWFMAFSGVLFIFLGASASFYSKNLSLNQLDIAILCFLIYCSINNASKESNIFHLNTILSLSSAFIYLAVRSSNLMIKFILVAIMALASVQIIICSVQLLNLFPSFNQNFSFTGTFGNPGPLAIYLAVLIIYCISAFLFGAEGILKYIALAISIVGSAFIFLTLSRSAYLGFVFGIMFLVERKYLIFNRIKTKISFKNSTAIAISFLLMIAVFTKLLYAMKVESAEGRVLTWKIAISYINKDRVLTGVGETNVPAFFLQHQADYFRTNPALMVKEGQLAGQISYAFNQFLEVTIAQGTIGLFLYLYLTILVIRYCYQLVLSTKKEKNNRLLNFGVIAAISVILISSFFSYALSVMPIYVIYLFFFGITFKAKFT